MNDVLVNENFDTRSQKILQVAKQLYQSNPDWVTFFREVLGVDGAARSVFPDQNDYVSFEKTTQYSEIQQMVTNLRNRKIPGGSHNEATRVITVRLPESLHEAAQGRGRGPQDQHEQAVHLQAAAGPQRRGKQRGDGGRPGCRCRFTPSVPTADTGCHHPDAHADQSVPSPGPSQPSARADGHAGHPPNWKLLDRVSFRCEHAWYPEQPIAATGLGPVTRICFRLPRV